MFLEYAERPITNLMEQPTHFIKKMIVVYYGGTFVGEPLPTHSATTHLQHEKIVESLFVHVVPIIAMPRCATAELRRGVVLNCRMFLSIILACLLLEPLLIFQIPLAIVLRSVWQVLPLS